MPKFFKQSILNTTPTTEDYATPPELIHHNTVELPSTSQTTGFHIPEYHPDPTTSHIPHEHLPEKEKSTEIIFPMPKDDEPLLPSPLDTPELTEHASSVSNTQPAESISNTNPIPPITPSAEPPINPPIYAPQMTMNNGFNGFPLPESKLVETLMSWRAPSRPHRKKNRSFYTTVAIIIILIAMICLLAGERMLVAVLFALMFLVYVLNFIEPGEVDFKISTQGVTIDDHFYHWQEMDSFWFEKKDGYTVLHILTQLRFPSMVMLVLAPTTREEDVRKVVARFLPYHEIAPKSVIEKWAESLQRYFPLENPHK